MNELASNISLLFLIFSTFTYVLIKFNKYSFNIVMQLQINVYYYCIDLKCIKFRFLI